MTFDKTEYRLRIKKARDGLAGDKLDAMLVSKDENLRYFTGVDSGRLLICEAGAKFWLNEVYFDRAKHSPIKPIPYKKDMVKQFILKSGFKSVGIDPMSTHAFRSIDIELRKFLKPVDLVEDLRKIKSKAEIDCLRKSARIASDAMKRAQEWKLAGMDEFKLAAKVEYEIRKSGSEKTPFGGGILCLSGPNTRFPHAPPSNRKIMDGDMVILDIGAVYEGYYSDMTRTLEIGDVGKKKHEIKEFLDDLKMRAIDRVEVGMEVSELHTFIEKEIEKKGYKFAHLSGHGVGLEIHEKPSLSSEEKDVFQEGMVFTIEPGIYTNTFGARSEDTVVLGKDKEILTQF
jgi:Xaa-Pro aminopeptidase